MNIGIVTTWFPAGAGYVSKAYRFVLEKEHAVFIYARAGENKQGDLEWDDPNVTWAPSHYVATGIWPRHFRAWIRKNKINLIIFNEQRQWLPVVIAKREGVIAGAYIDYYTQKTVPAFSLFDFLICNTKRHYSVFSWHPHCYYIPWGVDTEKFKPRSINVPRPITFLISAGWEGKWEGDRRGTLLALNAFRRIKGDCRLLVYSQVALAEMRPEWKVLLSEDSRIELRVGTYDPFPFNEGDVYLYPSRLDGVGLTLPEAASSGLAAITTNSGPMNEFVIDHHTGLLVTVEKYLGRCDGYYWAESICSLDSLAMAMQYYVDNLHGLSEHKRNAREYVIEHLDWMKNSAPLMAVIKGQYAKEVTAEDVQRVTAIDRIYAQNIWHRFKGLCFCLRTWIRSY